MFPLRDTGKLWLVFQATFITIGFWKFTTITYFFKSNDLLGPFLRWDTVSFSLKIFLKSLSPFLSQSSDRLPVVPLNDNNTDSLVLFHMTVVCILFKSISLADYFHLSLEFFRFSQYLLQRSESNTDLASQLICQSQNLLWSVIGGLILHT